MMAGLLDLTAFIIYDLDTSKASQLFYRVSFNLVSLDMFFFVMSSLDMFGKNTQSQYSLFSISCSNCVTRFGVKL